MFNYRRVYPVDRVHQLLLWISGIEAVNAPAVSCGHNTFYTIDAAITETIEVWSPGDRIAVRLVPGEIWPALALKRFLRWALKTAHLARGPVAEIRSVAVFAATSCPAAGGYGVRLPPRERLSLNPRSSQSHTSRQLEPGHIERSLWSLQYSPVPGIPFCHPGVSCNWEGATMGQQHIIPNTAVV